MFKGCSVESLRASTRSSHALLSEQATHGDATKAWKPVSDPQASLRTGLGGIRRSRAMQSRWPGALKTMNGVGYDWKHF